MNLRTHVHPGGAIFAATLAVLFCAAGCGTTDKAAQQTLPPIRTTIVVTTSSTSTIPPGQRFYMVKSGDTLGNIAASFQVTVQSIVDANGLKNPDDIKAGQTIEIPSGIVVVQQLPSVPPVATTTKP
jgi:LysM repeat protein